MLLTNHPSLYRTGFFQLDKTRDEWNSKTQGKEPEMDDTVWNLSVFDFEWQVGVDPFLKVDPGLGSHGGSERSFGR